MSQVHALDLGVTSAVAFSGAASLQGSTGVLGALVLDATGVLVPLLPWVCSSCHGCHSSHWCLLSRFVLGDAGAQVPLDMGADLLWVS